MRAVLILALASSTAACGDGGDPQQPDAPPAPDAPGDPALVTLTITRGSAPLTGIEVHFQRADSSLVATVRTDANGVASAALDTGGFVTAVSPFDPQDTTLFSYAGVQPGDALTLHAARDRALIDVEVRAPADPAATAYMLYTSCNFGQYELAPGPGGPAARIQIPGCPTTDMLVEAYDAGGIPRRFLFRADVPLSRDASIDLAASEYRDVIDVTYTYKHVPDGLSNIFALTSQMNATGMSLFRAILADTEDGTAVTTEKRPNPPGVRQLVRSEIITGGGGVHYVDEWGPIADYTLELEGALLREYTTQPVFDAGEHTLAWSTAPSGLAPDLVSTRLRFTRAEPARSWRWLLAGPAGTTDELVFPVLPGDAQSLNPLPSDAVEYEVLHTAKVPGGWDAVRESFYGDRITGLMRDPAGRAVFQSLTLDFPATVDIPATLGDAQPRGALGAARPVRRSSVTYR